MIGHDEPNEDNDFLATHVALLLRNYEQFTGNRLIDGDVSPQEAARKIFYAPFVVLSHGTQDDPVFNYANQAALTLFEMTWEEITSLPSRKSAELPNRDERARFLEQVSRNGFISNYSGVRISRNNKRFMIKEAVVWNLLDEKGNYRGQAATFGNWEFLG